MTVSVNAPNTILSRTLEFMAWPMPPRRRDLRGDSRLDPTPVSILTEHFGYPTGYDG
jgi:hypothetical protein